MVEKTERKRMAQAKPYITINGQKITWPYIGLVRKRLNNDWDMTIDAFYKAARATKESEDPRAIMRYIEHGFMPDKTGKKHNFFPSNIRQSPGGMNQLQEWWDKFYTPVVSESNGIKNDLKNVLRELANNL